MNHDTQANEQKGRKPKHREETSGTEAVSSQGKGGAAAEAGVRKAKAGSRFAHWVLVSRDSSKKWNCACDCGNIKLVDISSVLDGRSTSCGCKRSRKRVQLTGMKFGKLLVLSLHSTTTVPHSWKCVCECGNETVKSQQSLLFGKTKSCGCLRSELSAVRKTKHGYSKNHYLYSTWVSMRDRCNNPNNSSYFRYGGRGISVCKRWDDFKAFIDDMGDRPDGCSLDRIDNSKGYSKDNCKWSSMSEQCNNKRGNVLIDIDGEVRTATQWERMLGLKSGTVTLRIRRGWAREKALLPTKLSRSTSSSSSEEVPPPPDASKASPVERVPLRK